MVDATRRMLRSARVVSVALALYLKGHPIGRVFAAPFNVALSDLDPR
jgi:hypothetical protein